MLIRKNGVTLDVTKGAYKALFAPYGWEKAGSKGKRHQNTTTTMNGQEIRSEDTPKEEEVNERVIADEVPFGNMLNQDEEYVEDNEEINIPLTEMTVEELREYAEDNGINLGKVTKKADIIATIKEAERLSDEE